MASAAPPHSASLCGTYGTSSRRTVADAPGAGAAAEPAKTATVSARATPTVHRDCRTNIGLLRDDDDEQENDDDRRDGEGHGLDATDDAGGLVGARGDLRQLR